MRGTCTEHEVDDWCVKAKNLTFRYKEGMVVMIRPIPHFIDVAYEEPDKYVSKKQSLQSLEYSTPDT